MVTIRHRRMHDFSNFCRVGLNGVELTYPVKENTRQIKIKGKQIKVKDPG